MKLLIWTWYLKREEIHSTALWFGQIQILYFLNEKHSDGVLEAIVLHLYTKTQQITFCQLEKNPSSVQIMILICFLFSISYTHLYGKYFIFCVLLILKMCLVLHNSLFARKSFCTESNFFHFSPTVQRDFLVSKIFVTFEFLLVQ